MRNINYVALIIIFLFFGNLRAKADQVDDACQKGSWANCGIAVKQQLDRRPTDLHRIIHLGSLWSEAFAKQYNILRKQGRIESSTPDAEKIREVVSSKLDPIEIAKDKTIEALIKRYLTQVAPVLEWADKPVAIALKTFFNSSEIASDYDELKLMNDGIQEEIAGLLQPYLKANWKDLLSVAVSSASPQMSKMP